MVSVDKITERFRQLDDYLDTLRGISKSPRKAFLKDRILIGGAKYYLQISIECCLDIANHIIAAEGFRAPKDYADSFQVLNENGILKNDLCVKLMQMAKFRNRLVHLYGEIDNAYVYEFTNSDIQDITDFKAVVANRYFPSGHDKSG